MNYIEDNIDEINLNDFLKKDLNNDNNIESEEHKKYKRI